MPEVTWDPAATVAAISALLSLLVAFFVYRRSSRGEAVITWRLREPGVPVIDVVVKNIGAAPLHKLTVHGGRMEKQIILPVLSPQDEIIVDTLVNRDGEQTYRVTRDSWRLEPESEEEVASVTIDPQLLASMKVGSRPPLTRIATILERLEKTIGDSPVLRNAIDPIGISRPGEQEWVLPPGVRGVLLPAPTWRRGIHTDTALGDSHVRRQVNDEVVHQPQQMLRIVMDETVTEEEQARIRQYLDLGSLVTLHWHSGKSSEGLSYVVLSEAVLPKRAVILERGVRYVQQDASTEDES